MILTQATTIDRNSASAFSWSGLRQFQHVDSTADLMMKLHGLKSADRQNAKKQAQQLRYCLEQAIEYKDAASAVSISTKPVLLYYSIMSLALAQILLKGDGNVSLDREREQNNHHGLLFNALPMQGSTNELSQLSANLIAKPALRGGNRFGTFELWHRLAREDPITADVRRHSTNFTSTTARGEVVLVPNDHRLPSLMPNGITFLDCLINSPGMCEPLRRYNVMSRLVSAKIQVTHTPSVGIQYSVTIHPHDKNILDGISELFCFEPNLCEYVRVVDYDSGFGMQVTLPEGSGGNFSTPSSTMWGSNDLRMYQPNSPLNEFGYLYVGLFILGNFARYYPDLWMKQVDARTSVALASGDFMDVAAWRMAQCTFSELSRTYHVCESV